MGPEIVDQTYKIHLEPRDTKSMKAFSSSGMVEPKSNHKEYKILDFGEPVIRKAINSLEYYQFSNLKKFLPQLNSITQFIRSKNYLGKIKCDLVGSLEQISNPSPQERLRASIKILEAISSALSSCEIKYQGTAKFEPFLIKDVIKEKVLTLETNESLEEEYGKSMVNISEKTHQLDLGKKAWYIFENCFGTLEESQLINFFDRGYEILKHHFDKVFLIKNERLFKVYSLNDGKETAPEFVLFLVNHQPYGSLCHQIFIDVKGIDLKNQNDRDEILKKHLLNKPITKPRWTGKKSIVWKMSFYIEPGTSGEIYLNEFFEG